jgi:hypothetical protein
VDVLNGFIRLASERYRRAGMVGEAIRLYLHRDERPAMVHVADYGPGLAGPDLHKLARRMQAEVGGTGYTPGSRAEALPHFGLIAEHCEVVSLAGVGTVPWRLSMTRGFSHYTARADSSALRALEGTDVYLRGIDLEFLDGLSVRGLAEALQLGNHGALLEGAYGLQVCGDGDAVWVSPFRAGGVPLMLPPLSTPWGPLHLALSAHETAQVPAAPIILRGDRNLLVLGDITTIPELNVGPWTVGRLSGEISYPCLRRNPLQTTAPGNKQRLAALISALESVQPRIQRDLDDQAAAYALRQRSALPVEDVVPAEQPPQPEVAGWGAFRAHLSRLLRWGKR